jgi:hypothetical protein
LPAGRPVWPAISGLGAVCAAAGHVTRVQDLAGELLGAEDRFDLRRFVPLSVFEPGPGVSFTWTALSASGSPITRTFGPLELRALH